jgi:hypothetical protein
MMYNSGSMWPSVVVHEHWPVSQRMIVEMGLQNFTINAVDILVIDFYALHIRTIDAFKSS